MRKSFLLFVVCSISCFYGFSINVRIDSVGSIENKYGMAGAFTGVIDQSIVFIGGSNFEQGYPWEGGKKVYHDQIYRIEKQKGGYKCSVMAIPFPKKIAHGFAATAGAIMYCFGGLTPDGENRTVYAVKAVGGKGVHIDSATLLPEGFKAIGAVVIDDKIYIPGYTKNNPDMYVFDVTRYTWTRLSAYPGMCRQEGVSVCVQKNGRERIIYLIGGRSVVKGQLCMAQDVLAYVPSKDQWLKMGRIRYKSGSTWKYAGALMAAGSVPYGKNIILLFGGDDGVELQKRFYLDTQIAMAVGTGVLDSLKEVLKQRFLNHKGFSNTIWAYNTEKNTWEQFSQSKEPIPVVTPAIPFDGAVFIVSGEVKPAVRSPKILRVTSDVSIP